MQRKENLLQMSKIMPKKNLIKKEKMMSMNMYQQRLYKRLLSGCIKLLFNVLSIQKI